MHGATQTEMAEFKRIKAAERAMRTPDDHRAVKAMAAAWVRSARSTTAKFRRRAMVQAVRGAHSEMD